MKSIELHTAVVDNGGTRREAGEKITVGTKSNQVDLGRAKDMVAKGSAVTLRATPAPAAPKPNAKKPAVKSEIIQGGGKATASKISMIEAKVTGSASSPTSSVAPISAKGGQ